MQPVDPPQDDQLHSMPGGDDGTTPGTPGELPAAEPHAAEPPAAEPQAAESQAVTSDAAADQAPPADEPPADEFPADVSPGSAEPPAAPLPTLRGVITTLDEDEDAVVLLDDGRVARIRKVELADAQGKVVANVGDKVEGIVDPDHPVVEGEPVRLKRRSSPRALAIAALADAFLARTPLECRVMSAIKGGYEVRVNGLRAFCPASQISLRRDDLVGDPVGQTLTFVLSKYDPAGRSLVVSRRKLLEKAQKKAAAETKTRLAEGTRLTGTIVAFQAYGAFVDLGGVQGLLHVSEMSHSRVQDPKALLKIGQEVDVVVLKHDPAFKKISLSMKALVADPWQAEGHSLAVGQVHRGRLRLVPGVGTFVEVRPGIEGLLSPTDSQALREPGPPPDAVMVQIIDLDPKRHRISLVRAPEGSQVGDIIEPPKVEKGATIVGTVERIAPFGVFVRLAAGKTGLLHGSESKMPSGTDLAAEFPVGSRLSVEILDISEDGQRIRLTRWTASERAAAMADRARQSAERAEVSERGAQGERRGPSPDRGRPTERRGPSERGGGGGSSERRGPSSDRGPRRESTPFESERGARRGGSRQGGERHENPAASKGRGFASFGDILKAKLGDRLSPPPATGETPDSTK